MRPNSNGFTLIELVVTIAILAILSVIAIPSYMRYVERSKASEAINMLASSSITMEQGFQDTGAYSCPAASWNSKYFAFTCALAGGGTDFTITAVGQSSMNGYTYSINAAGDRKTVNHPIAGVQNCWIVSGSGEC